MLRIVKTENGLLRGENGGDPRIMVFKGVPYAAPPVGALRWRSPQPCQSWNDVRCANVYSPIPMQIQPGADPHDFYSREIHPAAADYPMSEDCLYLNIWTPAREPDEKLPVLFYLHGGGFCGGYSYELEFDGEHVARNHILLVTAGYRLGVFGFFAHDDLAAQAPGMPQGNVGLEDQLAALRWVRRNIASFGGDPDRITVAGQSAGGMSVQCHMASPMAKGLFQGAILMSSGGISPAGTGIVMNRPLAKAQAEGRRLLDILGVSSVEEARELSADTIMDASEKLQRESHGFVWTPTIDHVYLNASSRNAFLHGDTPDIPCMIGACFTESIPSTRFSKEYQSVAAFEEFIRRQFGRHADAFLAKAAVHTEDDLQKLITEDPAFAGSVATQAFAVRQEQQGKRTYVYLFDHDVPGDSSGSYHGSDLWFAFDSLGRCWRPFEGRHFDLARQVVGYWANFVRSGDPNGTDRLGKVLPAWEPYRRKQPFVMTFRDVPVPDTQDDSDTMQLMMAACLDEQEE